MFKTLRIEQKLLLLLAILIIGITYLGINHVDLIVTNIIADAILDGHFFDLYDYILHFVTPKEVAYLPSTYFMFAAWNYPLKILNQHVPYYFSGQDIPSIVGKGIYWSKLLPVSLYFITAIVVRDILELLSVDKRLSLIATAIWITSPLTFFSQFIFGQYDIFYIFFMLLAIDLYIRNRYFLGSLFFGFSFTFKYFPLMVFVPLLLYTFKRKPIDIFKYGFIAMLPLFFEFSLFMNSKGFKLAIFRNAASLGGVDRIFSDGISHGAAQGSYAAILLILLCLTAFMLLPDNSPKILIYLAITATAIFAVFVYWNPQWIMFPSSFLALLPFMYRNLDKQKLKNHLIIDWVMMFFFIGYVSCQWAWNVDINMFNSLPLFRGINPATPHSSINLAFFFLMGNNIGPELGQNIYYSGFVATWIFTILYMLLNIFDDRKPKLVDKENIVTISPNMINLILIRFILGVSVFLIPALLSLFFGQQIYNFLYGGNFP